MKSRNIFKEYCITILQKSITGENMWLIITTIAAIVVTAIWYVSPKEYKLDFLSLMLWGASIMIFVDHVLGYEGGEFIEAHTDGLITNGALLGIAMLIPIFIIWEIVLLVKDPKGKIGR